MPASSEVLSAFERACIFRLGPDRLAALVVPELGNGPFNIVLESIPTGYPDLLPGMPVRIESKQLQLGDLIVSLESARTWEPCPDWEWLRTNAGALLGQLGQLLRAIKDRVAGGSLLALVAAPPTANPLSYSAVQSRTCDAADDLWCGWRGDEEQLRVGAARLVGLGGGLTPAGDDFLLGVMLCAWLAHPFPSRYCQVVLDSCSRRTTALSRAFLQSAASGECSATWHRLLGAMARGSGEELGYAAREVVSLGHTSGADALAGFLWIGLRILAE